MHIRYDLKNKVDLNQFKTQSFFFLQKEDCVFSFYLPDFSIIFEIFRAVDSSTFNNFFKINFSITEPTFEFNAKIQKVITPLNNPTIKDIAIFADLFDGSTFTVEKSSKEEVHDFIIYILSCMRKVKKMSALA